MITAEYKTLELYISVVTALLGLAYPMFIDHINGIADKYQSRAMSLKFQSEWAYRVFYALMVACLIELFVFPVLNYAFHTDYLFQQLISVQYVCVFVLALTMVKLYHLLMTYHDPYLLFDRIRDLHDESERLTLARIIADYGASTNCPYDRLYDDVMEYIATEIMSFQQTVLNANETRQP